MAGYAWLFYIVVPFSTLLVGVGLTFLSTRYFTLRDRAYKQGQMAHGEREEMRNRLSELERQLSVLGSTVQPLSLAFQTMLVKQLTHFHTPVLDKLLAKLDPFTLSVDEEKELLAGLIKRETAVNGEITASEQDAARMLPYVIRRVREEQTAMPALDKVRVVISSEKDDKTNETNLVLHLVPQVELENT